MSLENAPQEIDRVPDRRQCHTLCFPWGDSPFILSVKSPEKKSQNKWFHFAFSKLLFQNSFGDEPFPGAPKERLGTGSDESHSGNPCCEQRIVSRNPARPKSLMRNLASKACGKMRVLCSKENMTFVPVRGSRPFHHERCFLVLSSRDPMF